MINSITLHPGELAPHPLNSNDHSDTNIAELAASLETFQQYKNIVSWTPAEPTTAVDAAGKETVLKPGINYILAGHGLVLAAIKRGWDSIEVKDYSHLTYEQSLLLIETDNAAPLGSQRNAAQMAANLDRARALYVDDERMSRMLARAREMAGANGANEAGPDTEAQATTEVEAEKHHKRWQAKLGDVWQLGRHKIACLDCLDEENIKRVCGDIMPTFVFADPPYGINIVAANGYVGGGEAYNIPFGGKKAGYVGGGNRIKARTGLYPIESWGKAKGLGSTNGAKPFGKEKPITGSDGTSNVVEVGKYYPVAGDSTTETAIKSVTMLLNLFPDACHVWWGGNYYTEALFSSPGWIVWDKDNTGNFADCEMAWTNQHRAARIFEHRWNGMLKASEQGQRRIHPTQKPVALAEYALENFGQTGDVILDPFLGSGITVLAAEKLGDRQVIGFELEPVYISVILERWSQHTGQHPQRASE